MNKPYKKLVMSVIAASSSIIFATGIPELAAPITLKNPLVHALDGKPFGFNGNTLNDIIIFHARLNRFQHGHKAARSGNTEGLFMLNETFVTLDEVARQEKVILDRYHQLYNDLDARFFDVTTYRKEKEEVEKKFAGEHKRLKTELAELKNKHIKDRAGYENTLKEIDKNFKHEIAPFQTILVQAADQLMVFVEPFLDNIRAIKGFLVAIINEWQESHFRHDSALNQWKNASEGKELEEFRKDVTTVNHLIIFCDDLRSLMRDIVHSCPLGLAQYKDMQKK